MTPKTYTITGMDCAGCAREVEDGVRRLPGVQAVQVDFATGKMHLTGEVSVEVLRGRVQALGKDLSDDAMRPAAASMHGGARGFALFLLRRHETRLALAGAFIALVTVLLGLAGLPDDLLAVGYIAAMLLPLAPVARSGLRALRINRSFNINLLMTIAALGAIWIGEYLEGATVIVLFAVGEALEGYTAERARDSIRGLMRLKPNEAIRMLGDVRETVPVDDLRIGDLIYVRPGDSIAMDGEVTGGTSSVNQAPITGESVPVDKTVGSAVFAGTINGAGALTIRVTRLTQDNTLSRIIHLVEQAQSERAPAQRIIDRFAARYTPAVVILAVLVALVPPLLFAQPFYDTPDARGWLYRALSMLVIACPCALVISTPVTIISAITAAARRGVLVKGGAYLEALGSLNVVVFDKTGTLTAGMPVVTGWRSFACTTGEPCADCDDVLALAAAVEQGTSHPLAQAVVRQAQTSGLAAQYAPAAEVVADAGRGVSGLVDGHNVALGSHRHFDNVYPHETSVCVRAWEAERQGQTVMLLARDADVRGMITLADSLRPESAQVAAELKEMGLRIIMMTGDNQTVASAVGRSLKLDMTYTDSLPQHKLRHLRNLMHDYGKVAMVGDGINDTPALAAATVGIAMGGAGTPQALETADVVLMSDDLRGLPWVIGLARFARRLIRQNVALSFAIKAVFLLLAFNGVTSLWMAILADVGMSLLVTLNGMRPLAYRQV